MFRVALSARGRQMKIPETIEIVPPAAFSGETRVRIPGSKSITNRALVLAALRPETTTITGALWSEDTQVMVECLMRLGYEVSVEGEPGEASNRSVRITGRGIVPPGGPEGRPLELFVGNAGTAARFLCALVCLGSGHYRLSGVPRMHERPQSELFDALRQLGCQISSETNRLPVVIRGEGPRKAGCTVSMRGSSQFASALLLCAEAGGWDVQVEGENSEEAPYVAMTREMVRVFQGQRGAFEFEVEPDASSASYFLAADHLLQRRLNDQGRVTLDRPITSDWQVDGRFARFLPPPDTVSRSRDLADSILTAMIVAVFESRPARFTDLARLRAQECDRVLAMRTELTRCGATVIEEGDTLTIHPSSARMRGAEIETYEDHRIAMCFAILGLAVPGVRIKNPACVKKTFPNFFQKLAAPPPAGLGVEIRHGASAKPLQTDELFAD